MTRFAGTFAGIILGISAVLLPMGFIFAQGGISGPVIEGEDGSQQTSPTTLPGQVKGVSDYIDQVKGLVEEAGDVTQKGKQLTAELEDTADKAGIRPTLEKIWIGTKEFFADKTTRDLAIDTLKLGLQLIANIFVITANVIEKVLAAV
ncbi:MAG: hypothetical protein Q8Q39_02645 [bacterium]|nr:hypothetical protein [bacterium]